MHGGGVGSLGNLVLSIFVLHNSSDPNLFSVLNLVFSDGLCCFLTAT